MAVSFDSIPHDKLQACLRMRIADRSVLKLIRQWLEAAVVEPPEESGGPPRISRQKQGTPQGGVISPLLANLYLHWFDKVFHRASGPAHWAKAKLVRYADDFVVLAQQQTPRLVGWIEEKLESWMGLEINREKTRIIKLRQQGSPSGLSGIHVSVRPLAPRVGAASLLECGSVQESLGAGAGEVARDDQRAAERRPDPPVDRGVESKPERLG